MASFQFIDTFFFISLGITFALLLLLVYHFKQRISSIEQKTDTLFEIIQNLTKELGITKANVIYLLNKSTVVKPDQQQEPQRQNIIFEKEEEDDYEEEEEDVEDEDEEEDNEEEEEDVEDNEEDEEEDDDDEEDEDDEEEDNEEDDEEDEIINSVTNFEEEVERLNYEKIKIPEEDLVQEEIKIIKLPTFDLGEMNEITELENNDFLEEVNDIEAENTDSVNEVVPEIIPENIIVNKLQEEQTEELLEQNLEISKEEIKHNEDLEVYKKMNLTSLRTLVISKGLCSDASKLKKNDLLKLLTEE